MKKIITITFLIACMFLSAQEKTIKEFKKDFENIINTEITEDQLNVLFRDYPLILTPHSDTTQLFSALQGNHPNDYSMLAFKEDNLYRQNIDQLLGSANTNKRILAYLLVASTQDHSKEQILLEKIKTENDKGTLLWSGMALLSLKTNRTDDLFDFLVKNENFGDAHMLPMYFKLNKDSLRNTAYKKIDSHDEKSKILAVQLLSVTENNAKTEQLVKNAVKSWDINLKGYAIYTLGELQMPDLISLLQPFLNNEKTRKISLRALANSPTKADREYLVSQVNNSKKFDKDIMDALFNSKNPENLNFWLTTIQNKEIPEDHYFSVHDQPLLARDEMLDPLQTALQNTKDKNVLAELVRALQNRSDDKSVHLMLSLLKNPSSTVRYWTAETIKENPNPLVQSKENQKLIKKGLEDGNSAD
ncbi:HEAT repeat domain-containing protein [Chryseobacterium sp. OSA05B]|uniref:HEAT repeat domain-containing protein n=1 Tax=Chryseobacterium sp. OSA05B TaxID=2862650 RepID=UPI001CBF17CC|nr:HEAT repeat domain-containing protein [Chryseobacterium sp. OSA05B]